MMRVGLTGGLASGKSFVGKLLAELGCHVLEADKLGHQVLEPAGPAYAPVLQTFGPQILDPQDRIDRKKLGALVFAHPHQLEKLNRIVHPLVFQLQEEWFGQVAQSDPQAIAVVEAAIMIEIGSYRRYDQLILAHCSERQQIERAMARDHATEQAIKDRLARQMPIEEKKRFANFLVDTSGTTDQTRHQVKAVYDALRKEQK